MGTLSVGMLLLGWSGPKSMHSRLKVTQQRRDPSPGRHRPETVVAMHRIHRSASTGNSGRDQTETGVAMHRITHLENSQAQDQQLAHAGHHDLLLDQSGIGA